MSELTQDAVRVTIARLRREYRSANQACVELAFRYETAKARRATIQTDLQAAQRVLMDITQSDDTTDTDTEKGADNG